MSRSFLRRFDSGLERPFQSMSDTTGFIEGYLHLCWTVGHSERSRRHRFRGDLEGSHVSHMVNHHVVSLTEHVDESIRCLEELDSHDAVLIRYICE